MRRLVVMAMAAGVAAESVVGDVVAASREWLFSMWKMGYGQRDDEMQTEVETEEVAGAEPNHSTIAVQVDVTNSPAVKEIGGDLASVDGVNKDSSPSRWLDKYPPIPQSTESNEVLIAKVAIVPRGEAIFHEMAMSVEIEDEAAGEFVKVSQTNPDAENGVVAIDPGEWKLLRDVIDAMVARCRV